MYFCAVERKNVNHPQLANEGRPITVGYFEKFAKTAYTCHKGNHLNVQFR